MNKILKVRNVGDYSRWVGHTDRHPLVSVIDYAEVSPVRHSLNNYSIYGIFFHDEAEIDLAYGCGKYDYKKGTVICVAPGQIGGKEDNGERVMLTGWALLFHPDLLHGTPLGKTFNFVAIVGTLGLIGMLIKNGIVLMDEITLQINQGVEPTAALIDSSQSRLRPVMMASLTTILGMIPLLTDAMFGSLAAAIMGGLLFGTLITLLFIPVLYALFFHIKQTDK